MCEKVCWGVEEVRGDVERGVGKCEKVCWGVGKVLGKVWKSVLGCGGGERRDVGKCWGRCKKCFGVGVGKCWEKCEKVSSSVGKVREEA